MHIVIIFTRVGQFAFVKQDGKWGFNRVTTYVKPQQQTQFR